MNGLKHKDVLKDHDHEGKRLRYLKFLGFKFTLFRRNSYEFTLLIGKL
jgi:hypothetical protein